MASRTYKLRGLGPCNRQYSRLEDALCLKVLKREDHPILNRIETVPLMPYEYSAKKQGERTDELRCNLESPRGKGLVCS